ncbi:hypothetical protein [Burkholderia cenocepacia]|uniref:hypothetical protein n=1 Tax=Burkholderia cenocepacia TaxID=95486 RepID=UPI0013E0424E|nr:hypothetical protein [Burkholderia cenocepacia]MCW3583959.1 hypothetical protein [Burkholderia cenocepacia]MCW3629602.1 hypothetical protein [Burkholderia cenocepacia]MCW5182630.1 hypothetical protein [Burkholderia cenocepacia]NGO98934.1 hypothetical protein [Burkholderia cenocepacia]
MTFWYKTKRGTFYIAPRAGRWHIIYDDDSLGSYASPQQAAEELAGGYSAWPHFDPSTLGIPDDISEWNVSR